MPGDHLPIWKVSFRTFLYSNSSICILDGVARLFYEKKHLEECAGSRQMGKRISSRLKCHLFREEFLFLSKFSSYSRQNEQLPPLRIQNALLQPGASGPHHDYFKLLLFFISLPAPLSCNLIKSRCNTLLMILYLVYPQPGMRPEAQYVVS